MRNDIQKLQHARQRVEALISKKESQRLPIAQTRPQAVLNELKEEIYLLQEILEGFRCQHYVDLLKIIESIIGKAIETESPGISLTITIREGGNLGSYIHENINIQQ